MDAAEIAERLRDAGFLVLLGGEVESAGAARLLDIAPKTLRNMRAELRGPPWRLHRGTAWYAIRDVLAWRDARVLGSGDSPGADSPP